MNYYLGIDIGTTSSKAVAFSESGEEIANHSVGYEMDHPNASWSEQDPNEIYAAVITVINNVYKTLSPHRPLFISFSSAMHSIIAVNEESAPLTPCIIWADNRAANIAEDLRKTKEGRQFYHSSGVPIHSMSPLCKLLWLRQNNPSIFNAAHKFIGIKEYIFYKLVNEYVVDTSIASATGLLNIQTLEWDEDILKYAGVTAAHLSRVVSTKKILYLPEEVPGLSVTKDIPIVIGASDGALSNLGTGATKPDAIAVTIGTSGAVRKVVAQSETDAMMRTFCYHIADNRYVVGGANNNGAVVLQWLKDDLLETDQSYDELFEKAAKIAAGSDGLVFLPYLLGERAPIWNSNAEGVLFGLTIRHTKAHVVRAAMEGVMYSMYSIIKILTETKEVTELHASGGFARSGLWLQMLADVSNIKVLVSGAVESSALGAVMLGAEAMKTDAKFEHKVLASYTPNEKNNMVYKKCFDTFERLYQLLKGEMV
jgi:gluconokinase